MTIPARRLTGDQKFLLALLVVSVCINYIDRGSLSVGQRDITHDLRINPARLGMVFSAFFWTYASFQLLGGLLVDRWRVTSVYGVAFLVWSAAMAATGLVSGLTSLLFLRLLLGAGESFAYPSYSRILAASFREEQRGLANALIDAGSKLGPALGVLIGGLTMEIYGWRAFFIAAGIISFIWLIPWFRFAPQSSICRGVKKDCAPSLGRILRERSAWATFAGLICGNYGWYFMVFWLPPYLENERHFSHHDMAIFGSVPFWGVAATSLFGGWLSDRLIASGLSPNRVRKTFVAAGLTASTLIVPAMLSRDNRLSLTFLTLGCASFGFYASNVWAITQTLAGPDAAGKWTGLQNGLGNIPGMFGLWFTGWIIQTTGRYFMAFVAAALFLLGGAFTFLFLVGRVEPIYWDSTELPPDPVVRLPGLAP